MFCRPATLVASLPRPLVATRSAAVVRCLPSVRPLSDSSSGNRSGPKPAAAKTQAAVRPSAVVNDNELVLEGTATEVISAPIAASTPTSASATLSHSADLSLFLQSLSNARAPSAAAAAAAAAPTSHRPTGPALPLLNADHPLMTDDFGVLPPFASPTSQSTTFGHLTVSSAEAEAQLALGERQAMMRLIGHPTMPYILTPGNPMLPAAERGQAVRGNDLFAAEDEAAAAEQDDEDPRFVTMQVMSPPGTTSPATVMGLLPEGAQLVHLRADGEQVPMSEATKYWMTSVLRKRRKKMNKHKLRKLRKKTRSQRK